MINKVETKIKNGCKKIFLKNKGKNTSVKTVFNSGIIVVCNNKNNKIQVHSTWKGSEYFNPIDNK